MGTPPSLQSLPSHLTRCRLCNLRGAWRLRWCGDRYKLPVDKRYPCNGDNCIKKNVSSDAHKELARKISAQSTVLVKNDGGLLPLSRKLKIVLIGNDANDPYVSGQGSGGVATSDRLVSPFAAFRVSKHAIGQ